MIEVLFYDPVGGGGMNSFGKTVNNYVDHGLINLKDYHCGKVTYDAHLGTDTDILNFYDMDEGLLFCAQHPEWSAMSMMGSSMRFGSRCGSAITNFRLDRRPFRYRRTKWDD
jgi:hypothetical protein